MDDLLSSIRNDLLKICSQVNIIKEDYFSIETNNDQSPIENKSETSSQLDRDYISEDKINDKEVKEINDNKEEKDTKYTKVKKKKDKKDTKDTKDTKVKKKKDTKDTKEIEKNNNEDQDSTENDVIIKIKKKRKEILTEDRCTKLLVKNGIETRCSFRKIEKKDFCKKHLK
jgi:hypothetical protein